MNRSAGFTILEFVIGMSLLSVGLLIAAESVGRAGNAYEQSTLKTRQESELGTAMGRIVEVLSGIDATILEPDPTSPLGTSDLGYRTPTDLSVDGVTFGPLNRLRLELEELELDNGVDDDGDGLIDEQALVLILDENGADRRTVLATGLRALASGELPNGLDDDGDGLIDEPGFAVRREGDLLMIHLSGQVESGGKPLGEGEVPLDVNLETRIRVRN